MAEKDARLRLIEASLPLFATKGYAAVSFKEISEAAGVNSALINYYFKSKEGLYEAVLEAQFSKFQKLFLETDWLQVEPPERIRRFIMNFAQLHRTNPYIRRLMTSELNHPSPFFDDFAKQKISRFSGLLVQTIQEGIAKGQFRENINPTQAAAIIIGMVNYYFVAENIAKLLLQGEFVDAHDSFGLQAVQICFEGILNPDYQK